MPKTKKSKRRKTPNVYAASYSKTATSSKSLTTPAGAHPVEKFGGIEYDTTGLRQELNRFGIVAVAALLGLAIASVIFAFV